MAENWTWKKDVAWGIGLLIASYVLYHLWKKRQAASASNATATDAANANQVAYNQEEQQAQLAALQSSMNTPSYSFAQASPSSANQPVSSAQQAAGISAEDIASLIANLASVKSGIPQAISPIPFTIPSISAVTGSPSNTVPNGAPPPSPPVVSQAPSQPLPQPVSQTPPSTLSSAGSGIVVHAPTVISGATHSPAPAPVLSKPLPVAQTYNPQTFGSSPANMAGGIDAIKSSLVH